MNDRADGRQVRVRQGLGSRKGPSWGYQRLVLGAIGSFLSTFGENCPRFLKHLSKLTFEYLAWKVFFSSGETHCFVHKMATKIVAQLCFTNHVLPLAATMFYHRYPPCFTTWGVDRLRFGRLNIGRGSARAGDAQGTPTQSHVSPSILRGRRSRGGVQRR